jgi:hypothetical protein
LNTSLLMKILWTIILTLFVAFLDEFTWQSGRTFVWKNRFRYVWCLLIQFRKQNKNIKLRPFFSPTLQVLSSTLERQQKVRTHLLQKIRWPRKKERMSDNYDSNSPQDINSPQVCMFDYILLFQYSVSVLKTSDDVLKFFFCLVKKDQLDWASFLSTQLLNNFFTDFSTIKDKTNFLNVLCSQCQWPFRTRLTSWMIF